MNNDNNKTDPSRTQGGTQQPHGQQGKQASAPGKPQDAESGKREAGSPAGSTRSTLSGSTGGSDKQ